MNELQRKKERIVFVTPSSILMLACSMYLLEALTDYCLMHMVYYTARIYYTVEKI